MPGMNNEKIYLQYSVGKTSFSNVVLRCGVHNTEAMVVIAGLSPTVTIFCF